MKKIKKWKIRGEGGDSIFRKFDRHTINYYGGKRLSIRRRSLNHVKNPWFYKSSTWIPSKYINGLIIKYLGKPYSSFKRKYDERTKEFKKSGLNTTKELKYYFGEDEDFVVDDNGLIQLSGKDSYRKHYNKIAEYNKVNLKLPNLGKVRSAPRGKEYYYPVNDFKGYIKGFPSIGIGYIIHEHNIYKIPIYVTDSMLAFNDRNKFRLWYKPTIKKVEEFEKEWELPYVPGIPECISYKVKEPNSEIAKYNKAIEECEEKEKINNYKLILSSLPKEVVNDYGVGRVIFLVKRKDLNESNRIKL